MSLSSRVGLVVGGPEDALAKKLGEERVRLEKGRKEVLSRFRRRNHRDSASSSDDEQPDHLKKGSDESSSDSDGAKGPLLPWQVAERHAGTRG